jgi:hypothetical protein
MSKSLGATACYHPDYTAPQLLTSTAAATSHTPRTIRPNGCHSSRSNPTQNKRDAMESAQTPHPIPIPYYSSSVSISPYSLSRTQAPSRQMVALHSTMPRKSAVQDPDSVDRCVSLDLRVLASTSFCCHSTVINAIFTDVLDL